VELSLSTTIRSVSLLANGWLGKIMYRKLVFLYILQPYLSFFLVQKVSFSLHLAALSKFLPSSLQNLLLLLRQSIT